MATKTRAQRRKSKPSTTPPPTKKSTAIPKSTPPLTTPLPAKQKSKSTSLPQTAKKKSTPSSVPPPAKQIPTIPKTTPLLFPSPITVNDPNPPSPNPNPTKAVPKTKPPVVPTPNTKKKPFPAGPAKKFVSAQARDTYESIKTKKLLPKKGFFPTTIEVPTFISDVIEQHSWETFCQKPEHAIIPLVREFYANMPASTNFELILRSKVVSFSAKANNSLFRLDSFDALFITI
ncbi:alpha carbonic anhydrase 8-like [Humulus lupulus]|uniref:alpha carbonic anhydrase 8-like n=1 Tax=Humulus lupulus TaxID=3486 RepID=UPI002B40A8BE|nr:alpha carbonic anhydrase 8-like [Humulus lupulus]